jgi:hypothetical protein
MTNSSFAEQLIQVGTAFLSVTGGVLMALAFVTSVAIAFGLGRLTERVSGARSLARRQHSRGAGE